MHGSRGKRKGYEGERAPAEARDSNVGAGLKILEHHLRREESERSTHVSAGPGHMERQSFLASADDGARPSSRRPTLTLDVSPHDLTCTLTQPCLTFSRSHNA